MHVSDCPSPSSYAFHQVQKPVDVRSKCSTQYRVHNFQLGYQSSRRNSPTHQGCIGWDTLARVAENGRLSLPRLILTYQCHSVLSGNSKGLFFVLEVVTTLDSKFHFHVGWLPMGVNFDAVKSGYELMLSQGVKIIQNDSRRSKISLLYSSNYTWLTSWLKDRQYLDTPYVLDEMI